MRLEVASIGILCFLSLTLASQSPKTSNHNDNDLINQFFVSTGLSPDIVFDPSNIKQYWIDHSVLSSGNSITIGLNSNFESVPLPVKFANINETLDCKISVIADNPDVSYTTINDKKEIVSHSTKEDDFISYTVLSSTSHI